MPSAPPPVNQVFAATADGLREIVLRGFDTSEVLDHLPLGVYSALRTFHHDRFLWLDEHLDRTERSMRALDWNVSLERDLLRSALADAVRGYPLEDSRVRFDVLREPFELQGVRARHFIALAPFTPVAAEFLRDGVRVPVASHLRRATPKVKTTDFPRTRRPLPLGTRDAYEHVMLDEEGRILECSSSNIAFVRGDELVAAGSGVLEGVTLKIVRRLAPSLGLAAVEERLHIRDLRQVDEAVLTSSNRGIVPVIEVAGTRIGDGRVGPKSKAILAAYYALAEHQARVAWP